MTADNSMKFMKTIRNLLWVIFLLSCWTVFWFTSWQSWLTAIPFARFLIGLFLFLIPGFCLTRLIQPTPAKGLAYDISVSFTSSIAITSVLGLFARIFQLSMPFVYVGLYLVGIILIGMLTWRSGLPTWKKWHRPNIWYSIAILATVLAVLMVITIAIPPTANGDDFTYNAQLNYFQNAQSYTFEYDDALNRMEIARFWFAFWPLIEAILAELSGIHGLLITGIYIAPALVLLSSISIYSLSRILNLSPIISLLAVTAQIASMLRLTTGNMVGNIYFDRLPEDKVAAAFVLSPVLIQMVIFFFEKPNKRRLVMLAITALALMFTHSVILGMTVLICGIFGLITLAFTKNKVAFTHMVALLGLITLIPFWLRLTEGEKLFAFSITEYQEEGWDDILTSPRLNILKDERFYGVSPELLIGFPYELTFLSVFVGLLFLKRDMAARYIVATILALSLFTLPYTGWIFGMAFTPNQLWRLTWLMPFGISIAYLSQILLEILLDRLLWIPKRYLVLQNIFMIVILFTFLAGAYYIIPWTKGNLGFGPMKPGSIRWYQEYIEIGDAIHDNVPPNSKIVGGPNRATNDLLPSLSLDIRLISFRNERGGRTATLWESMMGDETDPYSRMALFDDHNVTYLLIREDVEWMDNLLNEYPDRFDIIHENRKLHLYQILP